MWVGLGSDEAPPPSPKFHDQTGLQPAVMFVELSVNVKTCFFFFPEVGWTLAFAMGARHDGGVGVGDAVGVGPDGVAVGEAVGEADGVADGLTDGPAPRSEGVMAMVADALEERVMFWPRIQVRMGVTSVKWPFTVTVAVLGSAAVPAAHDGSQVMLTSEVATVTKEFFASLRVRHMTRLLVASHGCPAAKDVGETEASRAPSRAAFVMVICE